MVRKISIAYEASPGIMTREEKTKGMRLIQDLQLDRSFRLICTEAAVREAFFDVLARPLPTMEEALGRREVVGLFHAHPVLLERLTELARRLGMSKNTWDTERARILSSRKVNPGDKGQLLANSQQTLILACHFLKIVINILSEMKSTIDHFAANTGYLGRLRKACGAASEGESIRSLVEFCDNCERNLPNAFSFDVDFSLNPAMMCESFMLSDFSFIRRVQQKKEKKGLFDLFGAKKEENPLSNADRSESQQGADVQTAGADYGIELAAKAVGECDRYISAMVRALCDRFSAIEEELYFYQGCVGYVRFLEERGIRLTFPKLLDYSENILRCTELYDLCLLAERGGKGDVVPNDVDTGRGGEVVGMLVMGENNSGKTVFLRSVGTAVFLAQCGLPIPAEKAEISLRRRIFTHFAKAEGELVPMSQAGRFEEEAAELAEILREMEPCSLLMMNETFQTTAYDEGSCGMYHILRHLTRRGCGVIFVTHLTKLAEMCRGEAILARTGAGYKIRIE